MILIFSNLLLDILTCINSILLLISISLRVFFEDINLISLVFWEGSNADRLLQDISTYSSDLFYWRWMLESSLTDRLSCLRFGMLASDIYLRMFPERFSLVILGYGERSIYYISCREKSVYSYIFWINFINNEITTNYVHI